MNIKLVVIGETNNKNLKVLTDQYIDKLKHYIKFDLIIIKDQKKKLPESIQIKKEGEKILSILKKMNLSYYLMKMESTNLLWHFLNSYKRN